MIIDRRGRRRLLQIAASLRWLPAFTLASFGASPTARAAGTSARVRPGDPA